MDYVKWNKSDVEGQIQYVFPHLRKLRSQSCRRMQGHSGHWILEREAGGKGEGMERSLIGGTRTHRVGIALIFL
jgi:hypothetical protein